MTKKLLAFCLAGFALSAGLMNAQELRVATVNVARVYDNYYKTIEFNAKMGSLRRLAQEELEAKQTELQTEANAIRARQQEASTNPLLSDEAKEQKQQELLAQIQAFRDREQKIAQWGEEKQLELNNQISEFRAAAVEDIRTAILSISADDNYDLVLDSSSLGRSGIPAVFFSHTKLDISNKVEALVNKDNPNG